MSKKSSRPPKTGPVWHQSAGEATLAKKPRYNGFVCGHGAHGSAKYCRAKEKRAWRKQLMQEGASHEAPFFFSTTTMPSLIGADAAMRAGSTHTVLGIDGRAELAPMQLARPHGPHDHQPQRKRQPPRSHSTLVSRAPHLRARRGFRHLAHELHHAGAMRNMWDVVRALYLCAT